VVGWEQQRGRPRETCRVDRIWPWPSKKKVEARPKYRNGRIKPRRSSFNFSGSRLCNRIVTKKRMTGLYKSSVGYGKKNIFFVSSKEIERKKKKCVVLTGAKYTCLMSQRPTYILCLVHFMGVVSSKQAA